MPAGSTARRAPAAWRAIVAAVVLAFASSGASGAHGGDVLRYRDDRLTVDVDRMPIAEVLARVREATGAEIRGVPRNPLEELTSRFTDVPLADALARLLGAQSFTVTYGDHGAVRAIELLGVAPLTVVERVRVGPPPPLSFLALVERHAPVAVTGALAAALGSDTATLAQLAGFALQQDDPALRSAATARCLAVVEGEPDLRAGLLGLLDAMDDAALGSAVSGLSVAHAQDIVASIAVGAQLPSLRARAAAVGDWLRTRPDAARPRGG